MQVFWKAENDIPNVPIINTNHVFLETVPQEAYSILELLLFVHLLI